MRLRLLVNILGMLGVLAHAGALVRHNSVMVGATFEYNALLSDLSILCHINSPDRAFGIDLPPTPLPSNSHVKRRAKLTPPRSCDVASG